MTKKQQRHIIASVGTVLFLLLVFLILWFCYLTAVAPEQDEGIEVEFAEIEEVEDVIAKKIRTKDKMVFCYYYWIILDNGPTDMATIYTNHLKNNHVGLFFRWIFRLAFSLPCA